MGTDGEGSLEPGIASGEEFHVCYPNKFLQFYYAANPNELTGANEEPPPTLPDTDLAVGADDDASLAGKKPKIPQKPHILKFMQLKDNKLIMAGSRRGQYTFNYTCAAMTRLHRLPPISPSLQRCIAATLNPACFY